ncbi:MAG: hypothetical protein IIX38_00745, partial [Alistipes sp.]|nr:hypothetical protein [Alistipes sp.]
MIPWALPLPTLISCFDVISNVDAALSFVVSHAVSRVRVEEALDAATQHHDYDVLKALLQVITKPYDYNKIDEAY